MDWLVERKRVLAEAIDVLVGQLESDGESGCACMGPRDGHDLCPCAESRFVIDYLRDWRRYFPPMAVTEINSSPEKR